MTVKHCPHKTYGPCRDCYEALLAERDELRRCCQATLLFYRNADWNRESAAEWKRLTGAEEATTKSLCDAIRKALQPNPPSENPHGVQQEKVKPGLYRVFWKSGGSSLASVGMMADGTRWLAPINWVTPSMKKSIWEGVDRLQELEDKNGT